MTAYRVRAVIGGAMILSVEAPDEPAAEVAAAAFAADDWNEAGYLRPSDVRVSGGAVARFALTVDHSIVALPSSFGPGYELAADDPDYDPDDAR